MSRKTKGMNRPRKDPESPKKPRALVGKKRSPEDRAARLEDRAARLEDRAARLEDRPTRLEDQAARLEDLPEKKKIKPTPKGATSKARRLSVGKVAVRSDETDEEYLDRLKPFIRSLLSLIIPDEGRLDQFLTDEHMLIWQDAFTHETFDADFNYEELEYEGDKVLHYVFPKYLIVKYPQLKKNDLTELNTAYGSEMEQGKLSKKMGLDKYVRIAASIANYNTVADLFESFFGALTRIGDQIQEGLGAAVSYEMIRYLFEEFDGGVKIDLSQADGAPKTQIQQTFQRFGADKPAESVIQLPSGVRIEIYLKSKQIALLQEAGFSLPRPTRNITIYGSKDKFKPFLDQIKVDLIDELTQAGKVKMGEKQRLMENYLTNIVEKAYEQVRSTLLVEGILIGSATAPVKHTAEVLAYDQALKTLIRLGVTKTWTEEYRKKRDFLEPQILPFKRQIDQKVRDLGLKEIFFFIPRKMSNEQGGYIQLRGIKEEKDEDGNLVDHTLILSTKYGTDKNNSFRDTRVLLVEDFLGL